VQPTGQLAVDAINSYRSVVRLLNASLQTALTANQTIAETMSLLSSVDELGAAVNQSVADSKALQQTVEQLRSSLTTSGWWLHPRPVLLTTSVVHVEQLVWYVCVCLCDGMGFWFHQFVFLGWRGHQ